MDDRRESRKLAAILVADVAGYSRLMGADESGTLQALGKHRRELIDPTMNKHHGRLVKTTGDGFLAAFDSAIEAMRFAMVMQRGMAARNAGRDEAQRIVFRIGINVGDIIVERGDIFGNGVNVAARLESMSEPGGICISRATYEQVRSAIEAAFINLGAHSVKNIASPIDVYALPASVIAELPLVVLGNEGRWPFRTLPRPTLALVSTMAVVCAAVFAVVWSLSSQRKSDLRPALEAILKKVLPNTNETTRMKSVDQFIGASRHRSLVMAPRSLVRWVSGDWPTTRDAEERGLERCQIAFAEPCSLIASDDQIVSAPRAGSLPVKEMPRVHYDGPFDPNWLPGVRPSVVKRADVVGYAAASKPKAAAYNVRGLLFVIPRAASQNEAEAAALKLCAAEATRSDVASNCFLYAVGNRVVLPERLTAPRTAP